MSVLLTAASSQYLEIDSAVVTAPPFTMVTWFKANSDAGNPILVAITDKDSSADFFFLGVRGDEGGDPVAVGARQSSGDTTYYQINTTTGYSVDTWHMAAASIVATNDRRVFVDGGSKGSDTNETTPDNLDRTCIGRIGDDTPGGYFDGLIAYVAIYNYAMNDAQVAALYAAQNPLNYDAGNLISCWPLTADYNDAVGSNHMTAYNTPSTSADNPFSASVGPRNLLTLGCG